MSINIPDIWPHAKAPISAGKSDKSIRANAGDKGTGNSRFGKSFLQAVFLGGIDILSPGNGGMYISLAADCAFLMSLL